MNWRNVDVDGLPALDIPVLAYRPAEIVMKMFGPDIRTGRHGGAFWHTRPDAPVAQWVPLSELMETMR